LSNKNRRFYIPTIQLSALFFIHCAEDTLSMSNKVEKTESLKKAQNDKIKNVAGSV
jgi:hypothetical protein